MWMNACMPLKRHLGLPSEALLSVPSDNPGLMPLLTFPGTSQGVIYSDLNFSMMLEWVTTMTPEPVLSWTLDGKLCRAGGEAVHPETVPAAAGFIGRHSQE